MKTACFTGHRNFRIDEDIGQKLYSILDEIIKLGVSDFYAGGALGWDMFCENMVIGFRENFPHLKLHLILPCPPEEQTARWTANQKQEYNRILHLADSAEIISPHFTSDCNRLRNIKLVEYSDICLCYMTRSKSGTGQTVRIAQNKGITVRNLAQNDYVGA